ncbi:MAG TPA: iron-containing redox enzyme family protein [Oscillatoriales cyanobacterium M4454_W2019_049]|nr:iron-containing redox enzyme family protein [Oscillatoriales cyanobacterium M4454_W2019_049]
MTVLASYPIHTFRHLAENHPLWKHPFLAKCRARQLTLAEVRCLAVGMYQFSKEFNRILAGIMSCCSDESVQLVILENLYDEMGQGDPTRSHPALFRRFTRELDIDDATLEALPVSGETRSLIETYLSLPHQYGYLAALGAVCFASEGIVNALYGQLQTGIAGAASFPPESLIFFDLHIDLDGDHAAKLEAILEPQIGTAEEAKRMQRAISSAMNARVRFFDGIDRQAAELGSSENWLVVLAS